MEPELTVPPTNPAETKLLSLLEPVFSNTYWIENALGVIEGIAKHAEELKVNHGHFFALVHQFALDAIVLGVCKLFDRTKNFPVYTIPELIKYLKDNLTDAYVRRPDISNLIALGVSYSDANRVIAGFRTPDSFVTTKNELIEILEKKVPTCARNPALKQIFLYRNKVAAHPEILTDALKDQLKNLPSIDQIEKINKWAIDFCLLVRCLLTNGTYLRHMPHARIAALDVVAKVLGKDFNSSTGEAERSAFYSRLC